MSKVDPVKEAGKVGAFVAIVAGLAWVARKMEGTWLEYLLLRGDKNDPKKEVK